MNEFEVTIFTDDIIYCCFVGSVYLCATVVTFSFMKSLAISEIISFSVALVWMFFWERNAILNIKSELLFYDFKWFLGYLTLQYTPNKGVDIFLCPVIANNSFIVFLCH